MGLREFPPCLSTPVEGFGRSEKPCTLACFSRFSHPGMLAVRLEREELAASVEHQIELTAADLWSEISGRLRGALNDTTYGTWFGGASGAHLDESRFVLAVPNDYTRDWVEGHFLELIGAAIRDITGVDRRIELEVASSGGALPDAPPSVVPGPGRVEGIAPYRPESGGFNAKYTFDSFVIGSSN